jgi:starch synthase
MRILFATPETCDFVQVGGLAAVSAALPRALLPLADIRIVVPGYPQVRRGLNNLKVVGNSPAFAGLPSFRVARGMRPTALFEHPLRNGFERADEVRRYRIKPAGGWGQQIG